MPLFLGVDRNAGVGQYIHQIIVSYGTLHLRVIPGVWPHEVTLPVPRLPYPISASWTRPPRLLRGPSRLRVGTPGHTVDNREKDDQADVENRYEKSDEREHVGEDSWRSVSHTVCLLKSNHTGLLTLK